MKSNPEWFRMVYCVCGDPRIRHLGDRRCQVEGCGCKRFALVQLRLV